MDKAAVIPHLNDSSRAAIDMMAAKAVKSQALRQVLMDIALEEIPQVSSRASRVIAASLELNPALLPDYAPRMLPAILSLTDIAVRRSFLKVYTLAPLPTGNEEGFLLDAAFRYLSDPEASIAVQMYSMEILWRFSERYPEIENELRLTLEELSRRDSGALCARGRQILAQLHRRQMKPTTLSRSSIKNI